MYRWLYLDKMSRHAGPEKDKIYSDNIPPKSTFNSIPYVQCNRKCKRQKKPRSQEGHWSLAADTSKYI